MRKVSTILGLALFALAGSARAQSAPPVIENAPPALDANGVPIAAPETLAAPAAAPAVSDSKMQLGLNLLPMLIGKAKGDGGASADMAMAYGVGLSFGYAVIPGLTVGVAPQALFNVKAKEGGGDAGKAYDLLARVAYTYTVAPKIGIYAEVLPGYSIVAPPAGDKAKGFVIAGGVGGMMDVTDQVFVNVGVGYQYGLQKLSGVKDNLSYLRIAVGAGVRL